jgi:Sulfotransferase domain
MEKGVIDDALFVTGMERSGTTLLDRLLASQRHLSMLSQPFPLLFVETKRAFLRARGVEDERYPLGHLFLEQRYARAAFGEFLGQWRASRSGLGQLFEAMSGYSGQYTRFAPERLERALACLSPDDDFAATVAQFDRHLAGDGDARCFGSKEVVCEEFVPFLLDRGFRCAIIIRDPRDVLASLNHGRGREHSGELKPTLYNVRNWRKSVSFAVAMEGRPRFHWCRYEDLVRDPAGTLSALAAALDLGEIDLARFSGGLHDERGEAWRGNSSFTQHDGVTTASLGTHRGILPPDAAEEIEATCLPELRLLGYETVMPLDVALEVIDRFREPYQVREGMAGDAATADNAVLEKTRLTQLANGAIADRQRWFLFERSAARLREALTA